MYDASKAVLLIDAGNTRIKFVYYESLSCRTPEGLPKSNKFILTHDEIERLSERLGQFNKKPTLVIGVNVAGSIIAAKISKQLRLHHGAGTYEQYWLSSQPQLLHLKNAYIDANQLGADRWLAMLGLSVHEKAQHRPVMLVSFGTATTVDTVYQSEFLGGLIFPGLQMMADSLAQGTAQLPAIKWEKSSLPMTFPLSTADALESGMIAAQAAAVLRQWTCVVEQYGLNPVVFYAGGAADYVVPELHRLLAEQIRLHGFDTMELVPFDDPVLAGLLVYAQHCLQDSVAH